MDFCQQSHERAQKHGLGMTAALGNSSLSQTLCSLSQTLDRGPN